MRSRSALQNVAAKPRPDPLQWPANNGILAVYISSRLLQLFMFSTIEFMFLTIDLCFSTTVPVLSESYRQVKETLICFAYSRFHLESIKLNQVKSSKMTGYAPAAAPEPYQWLFVHGPGPNSGFAAVVPAGSSQR